MANLPPQYDSYNPKRWSVTVDVVNRTVTYELPIGGSSMEITVETSNQILRFFGSVDSVFQGYFYDFDSIGELYGYGSKGRISEELTKRFIKTVDVLRYKWEMGFGLWKV